MTWCWRSLGGGHGSPSGLHWAAMGERKARGRAEDKQFGFFLKVFFFSFN